MTKTRKIFRRFVRDDKGANAVEAALVMPLVIIMIFGLFYVSLYFFNTHQAQRASERAGRDIRLLSQPSQSEIEDVLAAELDAPLVGTYTPAVFTVDEFGGTFADLRVVYEYALPIPFLSEHTFKTESGTRVLLRD
ncbi:pilus assembly protein [Hellea sp.]|nr:pilus assembly protein [Hellea sp.]